MTTTCIVQARTGSTRLPGKVLRPVAGMPMLQFMLQRLTGLAVDTIVVATSELDRDDPVAELATAQGVAVARGDEADVLARFVRALDQYPADTVIRLTADCPLMDPRLVEAVLATHQESGADYTVNTLPRTFPKGLDVEVMTAEALRTAHREATHAEEREHVTPFIYRHPERFRLAVHLNDVPLGREWWTVDTPEDLKFVQATAARLPTLAASWTEILGLVGTRVSPEPGSVTLRPAQADDLVQLHDWCDDPDLAAIRCSAGHRLFVAEQDGVAVGAARVDIAAAVGTVKVFVDPNRRGQGIGRELIAGVGTDLLADIQTQRLVAAETSGDPALRSAFLAAGFTETDADGALTCARERYGESRAIGSV